MATYDLLPRLTLLDEADAKSEGSLDPLGLYAIADRLAVRLVPGVRQRQSHPRFLTALAVAAHVCAEFPEDAVSPKDQVSEPWQVFEWYLVEGLVRTGTERDDLRGLPGRDKATAALGDGVPLSARRYLKNPSVFGFHGVYRVLANDLSIHLSDYLGETGSQLLVAWEEEQDLVGFVTSRPGPGAGWRQSLKKAVEDGLTVGATARSGTWSGWSFFHDHLIHSRIGPREGQVLAKALLNPRAGHRSEVLNFLVSERGTHTWRDTGSERRMHSKMLAKADPELVQLLSAIQIYEQFARLLQDAFDECLWRMTGASAALTSTQMAELQTVRRAAHAVPKLYREVFDALGRYSEAQQFDQTFGPLAEPLQPTDWVRRLLEHHRNVQKRKQPNGKVPWLIFLELGRYQVRAAYRRDQPVTVSDEYVHQYRAVPLFSFALDLGMVK